MAEARKASVEEQESPARRQVGIVGSAAAQTPEQIDEAEDYRRYQRDAEKRVGEAAMMGKSEDRAADETAEDVEIRSFGGEREGQRGQRCLAVQAGASQARAGQKVGEGFQAI